MVASIAAVLLVPRLRNPIVDRVRTWWPEVRGAVLGLRASDKLGLLLGGSLATELLFATALGVFANALGYDISLADLLVMNISVSLLGSFVPIPGNIGVAELGLTVGLVSAGMTEEAALAAVLLYRGATFYARRCGASSRCARSNATDCSRVAAMTWVLIVVLVAAGADRALADPALQRARPEAQPGRQRLGADRRAAAAAARPDPEPRRDGEGLRGARARHVRGGHRRRAPRPRRAEPGRRPAPAEGLLSQALGRLFAVAEAYPELKANENFLDLQGQLQDTEDKIAVSRQVYNDTVLTYHNAIQTFPAVLVAGMFGFRPREFFEIEDPGDREVPAVSFSQPGA